MVLFHSDNVNVDFFFQRNLPFLPNCNNPCWYSNNGVQLKCLPNFFLTGASRCGTQHLLEALKQHPLILAPSEKEIGFWNGYLYRGGDKQGCE